jgi:LPXTG-motif cell wall-anchored protein
VNAYSCTEGVDGAAGKYDWNVDKSLGGLQIYGLSIIWEADARVFQYSIPFQISGPVAATNTSSSTIVSSTTSSTASSSQTTPAGNTVEGQSSSSVPIVVPVVLGVVLGLVLLAALGWFLWRRNKKGKKTRTQAGMEQEPEESYRDKADHYGVVVELPVHERSVEVAGEGTRRVELE